jgi:hypothetical protein
LNCNLLSQNAFTIHAADTEFINLSYYQSVATYLFSSLDTVKIAQLISKEALDAGILIDFSTVKTKPFDYLSLQ